MSAKTEAKPASKQKPLKVLKTDPAQRDPSLTPFEGEEARQDDRDEKAVADRNAAAKSADKIGQVEEIDHAPFAVDQTPTQCFGMAVIDEVDGEVDRIPRFRFKRWYFGLKIVVDTFRTDREYDAADVEARREFVKRHGGRYAALGPNHSRYPHGDAEMRKRYPSLVEQLEEKKGKR